MGSTKIKVEIKIPTEIYGFGQFDKSDVMNVSILGLSVVWMYYNLESSVIHNFQALSTTKFFSGLYGDAEWRIVDSEIKILET
jgi:hypothetical protein